MADALRSFLCFERQNTKPQNFNEWKTHKEYVAGKVATLSFIKT